MTLEGTPGIEDITITPEKNPQTGQDISFAAKLKMPVGYEVVSVGWVGDDLTAGTGNPYKFDYPYGKHGQKNLTATLTYKHTASAITGTCQKNRPLFKLFFEKKGDDDNSGIPNWFKYWKRDKACPTLDNPAISYDGSLSGYGVYDPGTDKVSISPASCDEHYPGGWSANGHTFGGAKGIRHR